MEPLIYTNADREDQGVLNDAYFDLEYGRDDDIQANTFELSIDRNSNTRLEDKALVYIEGTEYGGMVKGIGTNTAEDVITYKGMTWHGLLNCHVLAPNSGQDYLVLQGDAHTVLRSLIERMQLQEIFTAPMSLSGITVNHKARYEYGYYTMAKMLAESSAKLKMSYENGMVVLSAEPISDYSQQDELDTTQISLEIEQDYLPVNHLVCLGEGELKNRTVVHLYANKNGVISTTQSLFGDDENALIYDYSNADREELDEKGREKLKELQNCNTVKVDIPEGRVLDIGDLVGAIDPITGIYVATDVTYKTVVIDSNGIASVAYKVGDTSASKSMSGRSESSSGGISYSEGKGITIDGRTINADVDSEDLEAVNDLAQEAKTQASNAASAAAGAQDTAAAAQQTADGKADAVHTHAAADTTSGVFDLDRIPTIPASKLSGTLDIAGGGTGANNARDAANNLEVYSLGAREGIPANSDLNTYLTPGNYACFASANASSITNKPEQFNLAFILTVQRSTGGTDNQYVKQELKYYSKNDIYSRLSTNNGSTWSDWIKLASETDLANYLPLTGGTLKGNVNINRGTSESNIQLIRTIEDKQAVSYLLTNSLGHTALRCYEAKDGSSTLLNELRLTSSETTLAKPLTVSSGGTGANTAEQARENLGAASEDHTHNYAGSSSPGGAATSANKLATARTITLTGAVNGSAVFDGSKNITITTTGDSEAAGFLAAHPPGTPYENENYIDMEGTYGGTWRYCPGFEFHRWVREE